MSRDFPGGPVVKAHTSTAGDNQMVDVALFSFESVSLLNSSGPRSCADLCFKTI